MGKKDDVQEEPIELQDVDAKGGGQQPETTDEPRFTQADIDRVVAERLERERKKYTDYGDLKKKAEKWAEYEEAQKSELQKAQERADQAERDRQAAIDAANERMIRAAFLAEAGKVGAQHPEDAYLLAQRDGVEMDEAGQVSGVAEAVEALVDSGRLALVGRPKAPNTDAGAGSNERSSQKPVKLTEQELAVARKLGLTPEQYAESKGR